MPVTPQQYDTARRALQMAVDEPDAFTEDEFKKLSRIVSEFQDTSVSSVSHGAAPSNFGEGGSMFGPTGMDMIEQKIAPVGPDVAAEQRKAAEAKSPAIAKALGLPAQQTAIPDETPGEKSARVEAELARYDNKLQNASKLKELDAPAEFIPERPPSTAFGQFTHPMEAFMDSIGKARANLPAFAGGEVEHFLEPSVPQFQRETGSTEGMESDAYKEYSDRLWQQIYNQAQAEGRPVVRTAFRKPKTKGEAVENLAAKGIGMGAAAAASVDDAAFFGMGQRALDAVGFGSRENFRNLKESSPIASMVGTVAGAATPIGAGGLASTAAGKALPEAFSIGGAALRGAAQAGASGAATTTSEAISQDRLPGVGELALGAGLAAPFGAIAGAHGRSLRNSTPLGDVERSGLGEPDVLWGVRSSPKARGVEEQATKTLGSPSRAVDMLSRDLESPIAGAGRQLSAETKAAIANVQDEYYAATESVRKPTTPLIREAMKLHAEGSTGSGAELPLHGPQNRMLQQTIAKATHAEIVPSADGQALVKASRPGSFDLNPDEAIRMGIDVERKVAAALKAGQDIGDDFVVRVTPLELNPKETEGVIAKIGEYLNQGDSPNKSALNSLMRASREVRDQFPAMGPIKSDLAGSIDLGGEELQLKGWSAFQHQASEAIKKTNRTLGMAGLPEKVPAQLGANEAKTLQSNISGYRQAGRSPDVDDALRELAALGGKTPQLEEVAGMRGLQELKGGIPTSKKALLQSGRLRLDPMLQFLGPGIGASIPQAKDKLPPQYKKFLPFGPF